MKTVLVGISGGVDSAVAVYLLQKAGYEPIGVTFWLHGEKAGLSAAQKAAEELSIPHRILDLRAAFAEKVEGPFRRAYMCGQTPNPCVYCNASIKFSALLSAADAAGIHYIATGHYAAVQQTASGPLFALSQDRAKDQTYFLSQVPKAALPRLLLPLGAYTKEEIRSIAAERGLSSAQKADSQEICFIPSNDYVAYLDRVVPGIGKEGKILDEHGYTVGFHGGTYRFTVGQRKGLGAFGKKVFVTAIDSRENTVIIGENERLFSSGLYAENLHLFADIAGEVCVKIRSAAPAAAASCTVQGNAAYIQFEQPQRAITPGQTAAIYKGNLLVGSGTIVRAEASSPLGF